MFLQAISNFFNYKPEKNYNFSLLDEISNNSTNNETETNSTKKIFSNIDENLNYLQSKYNSIINSDIVIREFKLIAKNKTYKSFLLYIDGMVNSDTINDFVLKPLMLRNRANTYDDLKNITPNQNENAVSIKKEDTFNLTDYVFNKLMPQNNVSLETEFSEIISGINSGNCAVFIDTIITGFNIDVKGFKQRSVDTPENEVIIKGPQEAFVENIRTNTSLIRRIINNENLIIESISIGKITRTNCAICYMQNIANSDLVAEAKFRLNNLSIDSLLSSGELEQLIEDYGEYGIPQIISTERPDKCAKFLMQGRIIILVNGNPYALIIPSILIDFMSSPEDSNLRVVFSNFLKIIRLFAVFLTLLLPGLYISVTSFHQEILPTELLFSILSARENVPFPIIFELLIMEFSFEIIREAGIRLPSPIGSTVSIVGALILGEAAVNANIVSPILIIIVAITGISSFAIPNFFFGFHLRFYRFIFIILGYTCGFLGIGLGLIVYLSILCSIQSFGVTYMAPFAPSIYHKGNGYFMNPAWKQEYRENFIAPKKVISQDNISMEWRNNSK